MHKLRVLLLLLLFGCVVCDVAKSTDPKSVEQTPVSSTILTKSNEKESKSKTEKRDSSDQTASYAEKPKDEPFRPIYRVQQYQAKPHYEQEEGAAATRYVATAGAAATPQAYYDKSELTGGVHYAAPVAAHNAPAAMAANTAGGILYASSAYRGPFNPAYQQQQHQIQAAYTAAPQQVKTPPTNVPTATLPPQMYAYAEPEVRTMYERVPQYQQQQQQSSLPEQQQHPHNHQQHPQHQHQPQSHNHHQRPLYHREPQQIQYVIAIPLSYMRQLQHQLSTIPAHASQAYAAQPTPPHMLQAIGPLARDHLGIYRPYHYAASASPPSASSADTVMSAAQAPYSTQFIQLPANVILAAAKSLYQQQPVYQQQHQHQQQQQQQQLYYTPQHILQPAYHQHHPQQHHQQPVQQLTPLYAYPVQQQQQHQPQLQLQQQQQKHTVVRIGGVKPNPSAKVSQQQHNPQATPPHPPVALPSHQPLTPPLLSYNPIYVQPPPPPRHLTEQQAFPGAAFSFARFSQNLLHEGAQSAPHFVRLSAPNAVVSSQPHYYTYETEMAMPAYANSAPEAPLPYFTHPGAVHYGSHLYHPPTPTSAKVAAQSVATPHAAAAAGGNQPQPHAAAASSGQHSSAVAAGDNTVVKYP